LPVVSVADNGTWHDVQLKRPASNGATELSFVTCYKQRVLRIAISSPVKKTSKHMPSSVSSDNSIQVQSSIHFDRLADSVADCIHKQTDAYSLLADAVWHSMEEAEYNSDQVVQA